MKLTGDFPPMHSIHFSSAWRAWLAAVVLAGFFLPRLAAQDAPPPAATTNQPPDTTIQVSFQGANVDMIVQWLSEKTGKSVIKHPQVNCQLTIVSSRKVTQREAINLIYQALSLEGFSAVESEQAIFIVPGDKEPRLNPLLLDAGQTNIPAGRQRIMKIFPLNYLRAGELRDKLRGVLSDKAAVDADNNANQVIVTDYNENLQLVSDLLKELDVASADATVETFQIKHGDAEAVGNLLNLILNAPAGGSGSPSPSPSPPPGMPPGMPGGPSPGGSPSPAAGGSGGAAIRIWPDKAGNRLIVAAPRAKLPEIRSLLEILDADRAQDVSVRMLPLKNVSATDLVREIGPLYQRLGARGSKEMVEVTANERSNSLIVLSSEANFQAIQRLIASLDTEDAQEKVTRTFALKNADAQDVAKQLQELSQEQSGINSRYVYFYSAPGRDAGKKMTVVADRRRNSVIIQAPPGQMPGIEEMVAELDEPVSDDGLAPRIYPLKYVSAVDLEEILNELFLKKQQQRSYYDFFYDDFSSGDTADRDVGRLYGKVRIISEPYSNALIITSNSRENLAAVEEVVKQLDVPSPAGESTLRLPLRYASAATVANSINILFAKNGSPPLRQQNQQQPGFNPPPQQQNTGGVSRSNFELEPVVADEGYFPWLGGQPDNVRGGDGRATTRAVSDLVGRVRVVADERGNALLISANVHYLTQVLKLIQDLDAPTAQVLIEARLVEVSTDFLDKLGVRWSPDGGRVFTAEDYDNSFLAQATTDYLKGFGGNTAVNSPANAGNVAQALTSLRSGVLSSSISMDFLIQFLRKTTDASVLAEPQINIRDNETGRLFVGQQVPIPDNTLVSSQLGGQSTTIRYKDVGVVLEVTPHINAEGDIELSLHAESSSIVPGQTVLGGALFDTRNFRTDLTARNGETLIVGGIIQRQVTDTLRKTPILGSIPGLGWAFKKKDKTTREVELMVFLRPRVLRSTDDSRAAMDRLNRRAPLIKQQNDEMDAREAADEDKPSGQDKDQD